MFFRHIRFRYFNKQRLEINTSPNGGISILFCTIEQNTYNYWVYLCPENTQFSSKASIKKLKENKISGIIPWGKITLEEKIPLVETCINDILYNTKFPSEIPNFVFKIMQHNNNALQQFEKFRSSNKVIIYEKDKNWKYINC